MPPYAPRHRTPPRITRTHRLTAALVLVVIALAILGAP